MKNVTLHRNKIAVAVLIGLALLGITCLQIIKLSNEIQDKFDGKRWQLPAVVYTRPLEIYPGMRLSAKRFEEELILAGYRLDPSLVSSGGYRKDGADFELITRDFNFADGLQKSQHLALRFDGDSIGAIQKAGQAEVLSFARLDPARIGSFHPLVNEDRILLSEEQIPELLVKTLMVVEDRNFLVHHGISIAGIARAMLANIRAGRTVQGGSTLTQQLVKNFFLGRERTLARKFEEIIMAVLLEFHYSKEEIMTAYINEVFLGQDGRRAVHGFGLAAQFYFRRDIGDLSPSQIAMLVGMVKGPSLYDPRKNGEKSLQRRDTVLRLMYEEGVIDETAMQKAKAQPLTDVAPQRNGFNRFPDFLELVKRQLGREYREEDLKGSGLKILTTLDPFVQMTAERQLAEGVDMLAGGSSNEIEGAVIVTARESGEVEAVVGGKKVRQSGFNRALDARRPIGSLVKPAVYLTALTSGYSLAAPIADEAITIDNKGSPWSPKNYDRSEHGRVALYEALAKSYNLATVRLGLSLGVPRILETIGALGYNDALEPYPSVLLGAVGMSPLEVSQIFQTIASGGFYQPLRSIQAVMANDGSLLTRFGLTVQQRFSAETMFLLQHGLQRVMAEGTGSRIRNLEKGSFAGKTGTTNDLRDSWFAGFSGDRLAVVWLGNDDNRSVSLTGSSGALPVWARLMTALGAQPLQLAEPAGIIWRRIDKTTLKLTNIFNRNSTILPFAVKPESDTHRAVHK